MTVSMSSGVALSRGPLRPAILGRGQAEDDDCPQDQHGQSSPLSNRELLNLPISRLSNMWYLLLVEYSACSLTLNVNGHYKWS